MAHTKVLCMLPVWLLLPIACVTQPQVLQVQTGGSMLLQKRSNLKKSERSGHGANLHQSRDKGIRHYIEMLRQDLAEPHRKRTNGSQIGQDTWVLNSFGADFKGYFLDLGAHDGELLSNTYQLEKKGWQGICVEPFPTNFGMRSCILERSALAPQVGEAKFIKCSGWRSAISGFPHASGAGSMKHVRDKSHCSKVDVPTKPLRKILSESWAPRIIDYVSLDVEGAELEVLKQFPFGDHCVRLWTVEHTSFHGAKPNKQKIRNLLESHGCRVSQRHFDFYAECKC